MADFFQPGNAEQSTTGTKTPSPAEQAMQKFKLEILMRLLNNAAGNAPTFKSFVEGGPATRPVPAGLGQGGEAVLQAMSQPGAFTSTATGTSEFQPPTPSMLSDIMQMAQLGNLVYQSGALGGLANILKGVGGPLEIKGPGTVPQTTGNPELDALIYGQYGGGTSPLDMVPGGDASLLPADYPGLNDSGSWWPWS